MDTNAQFAEWQGHQTRQLAMWKTKLKPEVYEPVAEYVVGTNNPEIGRCYRGQDIIQIILDWPDLRPCYAVDPKVAASVL